MDSLHEPTPLASLLTAVLALPAVAADDKAGPNDNKPPEGFTALFNGKDLTNWKGDVPHEPAAR